MHVGVKSSMAYFSAQNEKSGNNIQPELLHPTNLSEEKTHEE
jgi:hypothetical protein